MKVRGWGIEAVVSNFGDESFARFAALEGVVDAEASALSLEEIFVAVAGRSISRSKGASMIGTFAVAAREIAERKLLFLGAFVVGLLPLGVFLIPVLRGNPREARSVAVLLVAATIAVAFPLVFGATILVGDIAQKRLSFYFSRPSACRLDLGRKAARRAADLDRLRLPRRGAGFLPGR